MTVDELINKLNQLKEDKEIHGEDLCRVHEDTSHTFIEDLNNIYCTRDKYTDSNIVVLSN